MSLTRALASVFALNQRTAVAAAFPAVRVSAIHTSNLALNDDSRLFVGGLPWAVSNEQLRSIFTKFGEVSEARVVTDPASGRSRGFGFITFSSADQAEAAKAEMNNYILDGRTLRVDSATPRRSQSGGESSGSYGRPQRPSGGYNRPRRFNNENSNY